MTSENRLVFVNDTLLDDDTAQDEYLQHIQRHFGQ
jgi:hypothetical protein